MGQGSPHQVEPGTAERPSHARQQPAISVNVRRGAAQARIFRFTEGFRIGRDEAYAVRFTRNPRVASFHARVVCIDGVWWVVDLNSGAGTFVGSRRITRVPVHTQEEITLGRRGPALILTAESAATPDASGSPGGGAARTEESSGRDVSGALAGERARERPLVTPDAFARAQARQRLWFTVGIGLMSALLLMVGVYALTQRFAVVKHQRELARYREHAKEIFYHMKTTELEIVQLAETLEQVAGTDRRQPLALIRQRRQAEVQRYDAFMQSLGFYRRLSAEERLIHRVVNRFGEFSLDMPPAFMDSVKHYIRKWQRTSRFRRAAQRAHESGYTPMIVKTVLNHDLPPEFFYLALQESDFIPDQTGPPTRYGYAKGMWQFIPETRQVFSGDEHTGYFCRDGLVPDSRQLCHPRLPDGSQLRVRRRTSSRSDHGPPLYLRRPFR